MNNVRKNDCHHGRRHCASVRSFGIGNFSVTKLKQQLLQGGLRFRYETPRLYPRWKCGSGSRHLYSIRLEMWSSTFCAKRFDCVSQEAKLLQV